jgi:hypothetical protein
VIDCRNAAIPLIDYTARADEEWRHLPNNIDKIDGTHFQESEYFEPGEQGSDIYFFPNTLLLITFYAGDLPQENIIRCNTTEK